VWHQSDDPLCSPQCWGITAIMRSKAIWPRLSQVTDWRRVGQPVRVGGNTANLSPERMKSLSFALVTRESARNLSLPRAKTVASSTW